jgi:hypothetical protein
VISLPTQWALECGEQQGKAIACHMVSRVGGVDLPAVGGGPALQPSTKSRSTVGGMQVQFGYSCSVAGECAAEAAFLATQQRIAIT